MSKILVSMFEQVGRYRVSEQSTQPAKIVKVDSMCFQVVSSFNCLVITEYVLRGALRG